MTKSLLEGQRYDREPYDNLAFTRTSTGKRNNHLHAPETYISLAM